MRCSIIFFFFKCNCVWRLHTHTDRVIVYEDYTHTHTHIHMYKIKWNVKKEILKFSNFSSYVISIITWEYLLLVMN